MAVVFGTQLGSLDSDQLPGISVTIEEDCYTTTSLTIQVLFANDLVLIGLPSEHSLDHEKCHFRRRYIL